ncbi:MAG: DUF1269 domain-containing protein [Gammaproteobacteria bacterium]|nr:DUF1269 domain-containing protein [Gammaproteobacteria bacterium]
MRRRLYFLLPNTKIAQVVHTELLLAKIEERHMHVIARPDIDLRELPEAGLLQKTDVMRGLQMGLILGGLTGMILSYIAIQLQLIVPGLEVWSVTSLTIGGAFIGAFASTMVALNMMNTRLARFQPDIEKGRILYMVDIPFQRIEEITNLVRGHHPEADMRGIDPRIPVFP